MVEKWENLGNVKCNNTYMILFGLSDMNKVCEV